jgi:hypothetical protein
MSAPIQAPLAAPDVSNPRWNRRPANPAAVHFVNLVFAALGTFFLNFGYNSWAAVQPVAGGKTTTGTIVSVSQGESCSRSGCSPNWTPTINFATPTGQSYTFIGPTYDNQISTGETVTVSYLPSNPNVAHDISASDNGGILFIGFGVFSLVLGIGSFILGLGALHRRTGLSSAREGSGFWVGHKHIHSNQGALVAVAMVLALVAVGFFVV